MQWDDSKSFIQAIGNHAELHEIPGMAMIHNYDYNDWYFIYKNKYTL